MQARVANEVDTQKGNAYYLKMKGYLAADEWAKDSHGWMHIDGSRKITKDK